MKATLILALVGCVVAQYGTSSTSTDSSSLSSTTSTSSTDSSSLSSTTATSSTDSASSGAVSTPLTTSSTTTDVTASNSSSATDAGTTSSTLATGNSTSSFYTTIFEYTDICSNNGYYSTTTGTTTAYVCDMCNGGKGASGVLTTYTTVFDTVCPTGSTLSPATYTITEPCTATGQPMPAEHVPYGFETTVAPCVCSHGSALITAPTTAPPAAPATPVPPSTATVPVTLASNSTCSGASCKAPSAPSPPVQSGMGNKPVTSIIGALAALAIAIVSIL